MKRINFWLVLALFSMLCTTLGLVSCSDDDKNSSYPDDILGTWVTEYAGEYYPDFSISDNLITEKLVIEKDGEMVYSFSCCDENYSIPAKWCIMDGKFYYEFHDDEKMPEDVNEVVCVDYKVSDNVLELYDEGELLYSYSRVK